MKSTMDKAVFDTNGDPEYFPSKRLEIIKLGPSSSENLFAQCAELHSMVITEGFLTKLGSKFLSDFYRAIATMEHSILYVIALNGETVGLIAGSTNSRTLMKQFMLTRAWKFSFHIARVILRPSFISKLWEVVIYPSKADFSELPDAEILNFAVNPVHQGKGIGNLLFNELISEFRSRAITKIRIVTGSRQKSAQLFYEKNGAKRAGNVSVHKKEKSIAYTYQID